MQKNIHIAIVGLGFGAEFVPIYIDHPDVASVTIVDKDARRLRQVGERFNIRRRFSDFEEILRADDIDALHLVSGIPDHALRGSTRCAPPVGTPPESAPTSRLYRAGAKLLSHPLRINIGVI